MNGVRLAKKESATRVNVCACVCVCVCECASVRVCEWRVGARVARGAHEPVVVLDGHVLELRAVRPAVELGGGDEQVVVLVHLAERLLAHACELLGALHRVAFHAAREAGRLVLQRVHLVRLQHTAR